MGVTSTLAGVEALGYFIGDKVDLAFRGRLPP